MNALEEKLKNIVETSNSLEKTLYESEEEEAREEREIARIEEGYKTLSRRLAATEANRWGYNQSGWISKKLISKYMNSTKHGLYSIMPLPCKGQACPYAPSCLAIKANMQPEIGQPCPIETSKLEAWIVELCDQYDLNSSSASDRTLLQELLNLNILIDRALTLQAQQGDILMDVEMGAANDGSVYTQPVVSRYLEAYFTLSKRRQSLLDEMLGTRKSRKSVKEPEQNTDSNIIDMLNSEDFFIVEDKPPVRD